MALNQSYGNGGSVNSAMSWSNTNGSGATAAAQSNAAAANASALQAWREAAAFNAQQAQIQRDWQEKMANTTYQRSVADMKKAGINPILAANMGLGASAVGSGATASMTSPEVFMSNTFADQNSASTSSGRSWSESESGLGTFLASMGTIIDNMIAGLNASKTIELVMKEMPQITNPGGNAMKGSKFDGKVSYKNVKDMLTESLRVATKGVQNTTGGGFNYYH